MTDSDLTDIYYNLPPNHRIRNAIRKHLMECVTDEQLADTGVDNADDYINNWLGDEYAETRSVITNPLKEVNSQLDPKMKELVDFISNWVVS